MSSAKHCASDPVYTFIEYKVLLVGLLKRGDDWEQVRATNPLMWHSRLLFGPLVELPLCLDHTALCMLASAVFSVASRVRIYVNIQRGHGWLNSIDELLELGLKSNGE